MQIRRYVSFSLRITAVVRMTAPLERYCLRGVAVASMPFFDQDGHQFGMIPQALSYLCSTPRRDNVATNVTRCRRVSQ